MKGVWKFVGGCFVGAASAIVVSPKSGSELRRSMALRLAHGLERAAGETPEAKPAGGGRRTPQGAPSRTAGAGVMSAAPAEPVEPSPASVASAAVTTPVSGTSEDTAVGSHAVPTIEPERLAPPAVETPAAAAPASQERAAPPTASVPDAVRAPVPGAFAASAVEPVTGLAVEPPPAASPALAMPVLEVEELETPASEDTPAEVETPASEDTPAEVETLDTVAFPAFTPDASTREEAPAATVPPMPAEAPPDEAAVRPETAALAAAAQSAAAIGAPAVDVDAAQDKPPEASGIDDLRARIEQTKAAVREALEKPFSADEPNARESEGSATAFAPGAGVVGAEAPTFPSHDEPAAAIEDERTGLEDVDVRSAFAEGSGDGVWMVPEVVGAEQVETPFTPPPEPAAAAGFETPTEAPVATESASQAGPAIRPESAAEAESIAEAATAEASVWEPVVDEEPVAPVVDEEPAAPAAAAPEAQAQVAPASGLDQAVADAFTLPEETPPSSEAAVVDQAEMRRRIEETRSRLKAKAFDAMTSGEAALLAHEPLDTTTSAEVDEPLDEEVQAVIDRSLSQDDY